MGVGSGYRRGHNGRMRWLRHTLGQVLRNRVAGPEADAKAQRIWGTPGPRWHHPDDVIWHVNGDGAMYTGGLRSLLLQALHPAAMAGVAGHSGYKSDPWGRLQRTSAFIAMTTYGPIDAADELIQRVRAIHERVRGKTDRGEPYRASDPHLLAWVHIAETESFLTCFQRFGDRRLTQAEADEYVASAALVGEKLGAIDLPRTEAELRQALEDFRPELRASDAAVETARFLLVHPPIPKLAMPGYWLLAAGAIATLPRWARAELGLAWPRAFDPLLRGLGWLGTATIRWALGAPQLADASRAAAARSAVT